jgi:hypothetical protein
MRQEGIYGVITTKKGRVDEADENGDVGAAARALSELLAEAGFLGVASLVSTDDNAARVIITLSASQTRKLGALIDKGKR